MKHTYSLIITGIFLGCIGTTLGQIPTTTATRAGSQAKAATINQVVTSQSFTGINRATYLSEDFEGTFPPTGWIAQSGPASTITVPATQAWHQSASGSGNPGKCAQVLYDNSIDIHDEELILPAVTLPSTGTYFAFDFNTSQYWHVSPYDNVDIQILLSTDGGSTYIDTLWQEDDPVLGAAAGAWPWATYVWTTARVNMTAYAGQTVTIKIWYFGQDGAQFNLDNIKIYDIPNNDLVLDSANIYMGPIFQIDYTKVPSLQVTDMSFSTHMSNWGLIDQPNSIVTISGSHSAATTPMTVTAGTASGILPISPNYTLPATLGITDLLFTASSDSVQEVPENDTIRRTVEVTNFMYSRDDGTIQSGIPNISGNTAQSFSIGNLYEIIADQTAYGMQIGIGSSTTDNGFPVYGELWVWDSGISDWSLAASTGDHVILTSEIGGVITMAFPTGVPLVAGDQVALVAGHYGDDVWIGTAQPTSLGSVVGFAASVTGMYQLTDPDAPVVRLSFNPDIANEIELNNLYDVTLGQNVPNPFNFDTKITYTLPSNSDVFLSITDITGKIIKVLDEGMVTAGQHSINLYAANLAQGVYYYTLVAGDKQLTKKMIITK